VETPGKKKKERTRRKSFIEKNTKEKKGLRTNFSFKRKKEFGRSRKKIQSEIQNERGGETRAAPPHRIEGKRNSEKK